MGTPAGIATDIADQLRMFVASLYADEFTDYPNRFLPVIVH